MQPTRSTTKGSALLLAASTVSAQNPFLNAASHALHVPDSNHIAHHAAAANFHAREFPGSILPDEIPDITLPPVPGSTASCTIPLSSLIGPFYNIPDPTGTATSVLPYITNIEEFSELCTVASTVPAELSSDFATLTNSASSALSTVSSRMAEALASCSADPELVSEVQTGLVWPCTGALAPSPGSKKDSNITSSLNVPAPSVPTGTNPGLGPTTVPSAASPARGGSALVAGVVAAVGFVGAVAVML